MSFPINTFDLTQALSDEGLVPRECVSVEFVSTVDSIPQMRYVVNLLPEDLAKIERALRRLREHGES